MTSREDPVAALAKQVRKQDVIEGRAELCYKAASSRIAALPNGPLANPAHGVR